MNVDLRSNIDRVYNQGSLGWCGPEGLCNAAEAMYDNAGQPMRFSRAWLYWWANEHAGHQYQDIGTDMAGLEYAVTQHGLALEADWPRDKVHTKPPMTVLGETRVTLRRTLWQIDEVKRLLCLGVPVVFAFNVTTDFYNLRDKRNWREHTWDVYGPVGQTDHWVCIVGFDDEAQRFLVENSWGPEWGDGGFFGLPYASFKRAYSMAFHIDRIYGFHPKKVEGYVSIPYMLNSTDNSDFTFKNKQNITEMVLLALFQEGIQGVINVCRKWHITDKYLEWAFRWERESVRKFQETNEQFDWTDFPFASL